MIHEQQPLLSSGFIDMNGNGWNQYFINTYNQFTKDINKSAGIEIKMDSLTYKERQFFLSQRHQNYIQFCNISADSHKFIFIARCNSKTVDGSLPKPLFSTIENHS